MIFRAKAPLRLGFGGGGSDVPPYCDKYGGFVLDATINKYVYVTIEETDSGLINIHSHDFEQSISYLVSENLPYDGNLDLVKACINKIKDLGFDTRIHKGCNIFIRSDAPPGVGLGTSSTVVVSMLGALLESCNIRLKPYDIANLAWEIERKDMGLHGGKQDQYAAAFGGINFMEFHTNGDVIINTLRVTKSVINELQHNMLLAYTGLRHSSHDIIREQSELTKERINNLDHLKMVAVSMKEGLLTEDLTNFGNLLSVDWHHKKMLSSMVSNEKLEEIGNKAIEFGADGLKVTGAGGGGVFIVYCNWKNKPLIAEELIKMNCQIIDFTITKTGLETWFVK